MKKASLLTSVATGAVLGALVFGATPALSQMFVVDWASIAVQQALKALQDQANSLLNSITSALGPTTYGDVTTLLRQGFTQEANYIKGQTAAQRDIADASNTANARVTRDVRNAQIRDEHTISPLHCAALNNGQTIAVGAGQAWKVGLAIENVTDARGEAEKGQPAFYGSAQAAQAIRQLHLSRYCSQSEADAGLCSVSQTPNADQRASSLFSTGTYDGQNGVNAANDYVTNLLQPVVPAALRGDQLTSVTGIDDAAHRAEYNARMSLAHGVLDYAIATQSPSVTLSADQQQQMTNEGLTPITTGSWLQAMTLDVNRRYSDVNYAAQLQAMPPASVQREIALELSATNYLLLQNFRVALLNASTNAAHLATTVQHDYQPASPMPTPNMANN